MTLPASFYIEICYLIATALFVLSLMWLSAPATARRGVLAGEVGMVLAVGGTLFEKGIIDLQWVVVALVVGAIIGIPQSTVKTRMFYARKQLAELLRGAGVDSLAA